MSQIVHINSDLRQRPFKSYHRLLGGDEAIICASPESRHSNPVSTVHLREVGVHRDLPPRVVPRPMLVPAPVEGREGRASSGTRATA